MLTKGDKVHFVAIGGSVMHNLAITLANKGLIVSGSDDEIFEPSKTRLLNKGILPEQEGWDASKITKDLSAVIVGMHAKADNPELQKAKELQIPIYSFPEFILSQSEDKQRVVIAGSHGKTSITSMVMHVLNFHNREFDYLVGAQLEGFQTMVKLSDAPVIIIEGDEYPSSPDDSTPKFLKYQHHIALISGIAWDHFNVYKDLDTYVKQFEILADATPKAGTLICLEEDSMVDIICKKEREDVTSIPYSTHKYEIENNQTYLITPNGKIPVSIFGKHNMQNLSGAKALVQRLGITESMFYQAIKSFKGAARRLEFLAKNDQTYIYKDFAHAPSKVKASTEALKEQYPNRKLLAVLELHTYSSLNKDFINQYQSSLNAADEAVIYFNPKTVEHKKLEPLSEKDLKNAFQREDIKVFTNSDQLRSFLLSQNWENKNLLLMSSGNFDNIDLTKLSQAILA
ncbi:UDP-N-acetylmuramate--L-alanine ligase [Fulvivirgaceae bacterium LMO-SS25]